MKRTIIIALALTSQLTMVSVNANDSLRTCFNKMQVTVETLQTLQRENNALKSKVTYLNFALSEKTSEIDSLKSVLAETHKSVIALADSLNINISSTREQIQTNSDTLNKTIAKKSQTGMWIFIVLALVVAVIAFIFGKLLTKRDDEVASLSAKADKLNEEIVTHLSSEISEMQTLSKQITALSVTMGYEADTEQKLITTLADRITFMEMTLYKMDSSVRGYKQLSKSIKQMKDNLFANGYELVDMLGKDYHEGMKVTANFIEDEDLPEGKQVITGIIKPQINFNGKMIQSAQITVSQNI